MHDRHQRLRRREQDLGIDGSTKIERRKHPRYKTKEDLLSISDDLVAEVVDINGWGMSFQCPTNVGKKIKKINKILLLNCQSGTTVEDLTCRVVRSNNRKFSQILPATMIMNCGLEFLLLSPIKHKQLIQFIKKCGKRKHLPNAT